MADQTKAPTKGQDAEKAQERKRRPEPAPEQTGALAAEAIPLSGLLGDSAMELPVERHAALLGDPRFSHPANAVQRARILSQIQQSYGNAHVQRVVKDVQAKRNQSQTTEREQPGEARETKGHPQKDDAELKLKQAANKSWPDPKDYSQPSIGELMAKTRSSVFRPIPFREEMEQKFNADFGAVRAYTGDSATEACETLGAKAVTFGSNDIAFKESSPDRATVGHELTHVLQKRLGRDAASSGTRIQGYQLSHYSDASETQAREVEGSLATQKEPTAVRLVPLPPKDIAMATEWVELKEYMKDSEKLFYQQLRDVVSAQLGYWFRDHYKMAITTFGNDMGVKGATNGWSKVAFTLIKGLIGQIPYVGAYAGILIDVTADVIGALGEAPDSLPDYLEKLYSAAPEARKRTKAEFFKKIKDKRAAEKALKPEEVLKHRTDLVSEQKKEMANLPNYKLVMQPFIIGWVKASQGSADKAKGAGYIYASLFLDHPSLGKGLALNPFSKPCLRKVEQPAGVIEALGTAYGKDYYLDRLPIPMKITVRDLGPFGELMAYFKKESGGGVQWDRDTGGSKQIKTYVINKLWYEGPWAGKRPTVADLNP